MFTIGVKNLRVLDSDMVNLMLFFLGNITVIGKYWNYNSFRNEEQDSKGSDPFGLVNLELTRKD